MPKDTFFNLSEEKRNKIIEVALSEFELNDYEHASINQIVLNSEISKGSFYQYFHDKKDLFKYIIKLMIDKKIEYITPVMSNPFEHGFFDVIKDMNHSGLAFARDNPQYVKIGNRLLKDTKHPIYREIMDENQGQAFDVYELLLKKAIDKGEIRSDIDVKFTARIIFKLSAELVESESEHIEEMWTEDIIDKLDKFMALVQHGIKHSKQ